MNARTYIFNKLKEQEDAIKYNIGIVAGILAGSDNPALEPIPINIILPGNNKIILSVISTDGVMVMKANTKSEYVFTDDREPIVNLTNLDFDIILDNFAIAIVNSFNNAMVKSITNIKE